MPPPGARVRTVDTDGLAPAEVDAIRALMDVAFGADEEERFTDDDWAHAVGGRHFIPAVDADIRARFELGALGTGRHAFYERLGWRTWQGPTSVRTRDGEQRTTDE